VPEKDEWFHSDSAQPSLTEISDLLEHLENKAVWAELKLTE
jgi:hypothetical protein